MTEDLQKENPCKNTCKERCVGCHGICIKYIKWKKKLDKHNREQRIKRHLDNLKMYNDVANLLR